MGDRFGDERYRRAVQREGDRDRRMGGVGAEAGAYPESDDDRRGDRPYDERPHEERWQQRPPREWTSGAGPYDQGRYEQGRYEASRPFDRPRSWDAGRFDSG